MTQPNSIFNPRPDPIANRANWIGRYLAVESGFSEKLAKVLTEAASNIDEYFGDLVKDNVSTKVARVRIGLANKEIRRQFRDIFGTTRSLIVDHQQDAAVAAVNAKLYDERGVLSWLLPDPVNRVQYADTLRQTARRNIEATIARTLFTEQPLSARVYKTEALANGIVSRTINNALARGDSARNLAKDVRALIDPTVPGGVSYAAMRLGRTEINNAFHAQSILDSQETPWVQDMRWYLSKRHEKDPGDECEIYAAQGLFRKEDVPEKPHPNCRCFVTPELQDYEDFENALISGHYDPYLDSVMGEGFSSSQIEQQSGAFAERKPTKELNEPEIWGGRMSESNGIADYAIGDDIAESFVPQGKMTRETLARVKKLLPNARIDLSDQINEEVLKEIVDNLEPWALEYPESASSIKAFGFKDMPSGIDEQGRETFTAGIVKTIQDDYPEEFKAFGGQGVTVHFDATLASTKNGLRDSVIRSSKETRTRRGLKSPLQYEGVAEDPLKTLVTHELVHVRHFNMGGTQSRLFRKEWRGLDNDAETLRESLIVKAFEAAVPDKSKHNGQGLNEWFDSVVSEMPRYAGVFQEAPPSSFGTLDTIEAWAVAIEQVENRPDQANEIDRILYKIFNEIWEKYLPKKRRRRSKKK